MKHTRPYTTGFVLRPTVTFLLPFVGAWVLWMLWIMCTAKWPAGGPIHLISIQEVGLVTAFNLASLIALGIDAFKSRGNEQFVRGGQAFGLGLSALVLLLIQIATVLAYDPLILS